MDEHALPDGRQASAMSPFARRFGAFASSHFCYAISCFFACVFLAYSTALALLSNGPPGMADWLLEGLFGWLLPWGLMGGYALLGYRFGGKDVWPLPLRVWDLTRSVLAEAAVAWCWAGLVIGTFSAGSDMIFPLAYLSCFLALPSTVFVWAGLGTLGFVGIQDLVCMGFLAGLLPPLLFHLGSYWRACRAAGDSGLYEPNGPCL